MNTTAPTKVTRSAAARTGQRPQKMQAFGSVVRMPIALAEDTRRESVDNLNQLLADTNTLRDLYKKHHWQVSGPTFYSMHCCSTSTSASSPSSWTSSQSGS
jgi:starvation-inducible DNA-binding protein